MERMSTESRGRDAAVTAVADEGDLSLVRAASTVGARGADCTSGPRGL